MRSTRWRTPASSSASTRPGNEEAACSVLEAGIKHIEQANPAIIAQLYRIFPTQTAPFRSICEAAVMAGATIEPPLSREMSRKFFASRALASFEVLRKRIEKALEESCDGATFSECRVLQRLGEVGYPMRIVDLARQLKLTSATAVRATDRLAERGWVERMSAPDDRKAVYVACTDEGRRMQDVVLAGVDRIATQYLWSRLAPDKCRDIAMAGHVVMADLQQREEAEALEHPRAAAALEAVTRGLSHRGNIVRGSRSAAQGLDCMSKRKPALNPMRAPAPSKAKRLAPKRKGALA